MNIYWKVLQLCIKHNIGSLGLNWISDENGQVGVLVSFFHYYPERLIQNELLQLLGHGHAPVHNHDSLILNFGTRLIYFELYIFKYLLNLIALEPFVLAS